MTQEEKARAYDEAVQLARNYYPDNEFLDTIFPELRESEDERIRERIINILGNNTDAHEEGWVIYANEIAWLKKQKDAIGAARQQGYEEGMEDGASMVENAQKEQKPAEDLEKAAYKYSFDSRPSIYGQVDVIDAFIAGAEWQKEQMTKEAVEGVVHHVATVHYIVTNEKQLNACLKQFDEGTEVVLTINARKEE